MLLIGLSALIFVIIQSCQTPKTGLETFKTGTLKKLVALEAPPAQPGTEFKTAIDQSLSLPETRGKVVLLNVWATWCPPCVAELPDLNKLNAMYNPEEFTVITVSVDRQAIEAADFFDKHSIDTLTPWHDASYSLPAKIKAPGLPVSIFYDQYGREVARIAGEVKWTEPEVKTYIDYLLNQ